MLIAIPLIMFGAIAQYESTVYILGNCGTIIRFLHHRNFPILHLLQQLLHRGCIDSLLRRSLSSPWLMSSNMGLGVGIGSETLFSSLASHCPLFVYRVMISRTFSHVSVRPLSVVVSSKSTPRSFRSRTSTARKNMITFSSARIA